MVGSVFRTTSSGAKPMFFNLWNAALPQLKLTEPQHLGQETDTAISTKLTGQWLRERLGILEKEAWVSDKKLLDSEHVEFEGKRVCL